MEHFLKITCIRGKPRYPIIAVPTRRKNLCRIATAEIAGALKSQEEDPYREEGHSIEST
jgi:hypothetical protein